MNIQPRDGQQPENQPIRYSSDAMVARRRRIIETALDLMARNGGDFTMRDLAKESGVATGTLYNLFGGQDALVAEAVITVYEERVTALAVMPETDDVTDIIRARGDAAHAEIMRVPAYAIKMAHLYFAGPPGSPVRNTLHAIPAAFWVGLLKDMDREGALAAWVDSAMLADELTSAQYGVVARWAAGDMDDEALPTRTFYVACAMLVGALKGARKKQIRAALTDMDKALKTADAA